MAVVADSEILKNTGDAYVRLERPKKNFSGTQKLYVKAGANDTRYAYLYFGVPFPLGAKIISATLTLYNGTVLEGGADVEVQRVVDDWKRNKVTWDNRPSAGGAAVIVSKGPADVPELTQWDFNLTNMLQSVSDGADWFGVRFTANSGKGEWFFGSASRRSRLRPVLFIEWADGMDEPINLSPSNGNAVGVSKPLLSWEWTDDTGSSALNSVKVQVSEDPTFATGVFDSGWVASTASELDLAGTAYTGATSGSTVYWRCAVRDANNVESPWSDPESFRYVPKPTVTINNPVGSSPNAYVEESTPPILWSLSGGAQVHWQVMILDPLDGNRIVANSEKFTGPETGWTIPESAKLKNGQDYIVRVLIWDTEVREGNGESTAYSLGEKQFSVQYTTAITPVNSLTVERLRPYHWAKIEWARGTAADEYEILLDGQVLEKVAAEDVDTVPGGYSYTLRTHPPRRSITVEVVAVVNGRGSKTNPTVTFNYPSESAVLSEVDGSDAVMFVNYSKDYASAREQTVHAVVGNHPPILIRQSKRGIEGSFSGYLTGNIDTISIDEERSRIETLREGEGRIVLLTLLDRSFHCFVSEVEVESQVDAEGVFYFVSFDFYEDF